ncbi:MAG: SURF1 family cytochrome oxidase biogenesis protein, partial [Pseudolabrys sp.]
MKKARRKRKSGVLDPTVAALVGVLILSGLGIWQLDRKAWKEDLIAKLNTRLGRAPQDLPPRASWPKLREDGEEFRRVAFPAEFLDGEEALVYTAGS